MHHKLVASRAFLVDKNRVIIIPYLIKIVIVFNKRVSGFSISYTNRKYTLKNSIKRRNIDE